jgi:hypothetical protein
MIKYDNIKLWSAEECKHYLNHIQDLVDKKKIPRIPYQIWKEIKNFSNNTNTNDDIYLVLKYQSNGKIVCEFRDMVNAYPIKVVDKEWSYDDLIKDCEYRYFSYSWKLYCEELIESEVVTPFPTKKKKTTLTKQIANSDGTCISKPIKNEEVIHIVKNRKEEKNMFNFDFGVYNTDAVRFSPYGLAVFNSGSSKYVAYDQANAALMDVDIINFKMDNMLYKIPVAIKDVTEGDIIIHNKRPVIVIKVCGNENKLKAVDPATAEEKVILPIKSPFKFDFVTKVVSIMDFSNTKASESSPFGNFLPFMLMSNSDSAEMNPFMLMALMGNNGFELDNPLMLMALAGNNNAEMGNMLPLMMLMNQK